MSPLSCSSNGLSLSSRQGNMFVAARLPLGLTQAQLASLARVNRLAVTDVEQGTGNPSSVRRRSYKVFTV